MKLASCRIPGPPPKFWQFPLLLRNPTRRRVGQVAGQTDNFLQILAGSPTESSLSGLAWRWGCGFRNKRAKPCPDHRSNPKSVVFARRPETRQNAFWWPCAGMGVRYSESARKSMPRASLKSGIGESSGQYVRFHWEMCVCGLA